MGRHLVTLAAFPMQSDPPAGHACVPVADGGGKELEEPPAGALAGVSDDAGHHDGARRQNRSTGGPVDGELPGHAQILSGRPARCALQAARTPGGSQLTRPAPLDPDDGWPSIVLKIEFIGRA
jgi:hypothetical protein